MHIAIDAHMVGERETGNETYILNLARALLDLPADAWGKDRFDISLLATHPERLRAAIGQELPGHARILVLRPRQPLLRIPLVMPYVVARSRADLLHVTYNAPPINPCPIVVTIHDISFEHYPQYFSPRDRLILKTLVPLSAQRAARIITVSRHAQAEIIDRYRVPAHKVAVTYEAAGPQFHPVDDPLLLTAVRRRYGIGSGPFVLALGNLQPRKNIRRLVQAFAAVVARVKAEEPPSAGSPTAGSMQLVVAGKAQWRESEIFHTVTEAGLEGRVVFPGYVAQEDLPALYSAATTFVYPSLYEGFGLPPLEAMACGTPVICSWAASLPEVTGDAALMVDPADAGALAQALADLMGNPGLQADLCARGLQRVAQFSWDRCARETLAVYREALAEGGQR